MEAKEKQLKERLKNFKKGRNLFTDFLFINLFIYFFFFFAWLILLVNDAFKK